MPCRKFSIKNSKDHAEQFLNCVYGVLSGTMCEMMLELVESSEKRELRDCNCGVDCGAAALFCPR